MVSMARFDLVSEYKNFPTAKKHRVVLETLFDYFMVAIVSIIVFSALGAPIFRGLPATESYLNGAEARNSALKEVESATRLNEFDDNGNFKTEQSLCDSFLLSLAKTSYFERDAAFPSRTEASAKPTIEETFFLDLDEGTYPNDGLAYYFFTFKGEQPSLSFYIYEGNDYSLDKDSFLFGQAFEFDSAHFQTLTYPFVLNEEAALALSDYYVFGDTSGNNGVIQRSLSTSYKKARAFFIEETEKHYEPYLSLMASYSIEHRGFAGGYMLTLSLCYLLAFILMETVFPLVFKGGRTLGMKVLDLGYATIGEMEPRFWQYIIKSAVRSLPYYSTILISSFLLFSFAFMQMDLGGGFMMVYPALASLFIGIGSLFAVVVFSRNQTLAEASSFLLIKDLKAAVEGESENSPRGGNL